MRKTLITLGILVVLLVSTFGSVGAQSDTPATQTPTAVPTTETETETEDTLYFSHPIVQLLSVYFDRVKVVEETDEATSEDEIAGEETDPTMTATPAPTGEPGEAEEETQSSVEQLAEEIAGYHEAGMGFGQLVKIYAMVQASEEACAAEDGDEAPAAESTEDVETCSPLVVDDLVTAVQSGTGMGSLFKEYGKPAMLGVGHVKQALKEQNKQSESDVEDNEETDLDETETDIDDESATDTQSVTDEKGNKPDKDKSNKQDKGNKPQKDKTNNSKGNRK